MRETIPETVVRIRIVCDACTADCSKNENGLRSGQCVMCKNDLCGDCLIYDHRDGSDYPPVYCQRCWRIGEPFRKQQADAELEHDTRLAGIEQAWIRACGR